MMVASTIVPRLNSKPLRVRSELIASMIFGAKACASRRAKTEEHGFFRNGARHPQPRELPHRRDFVQRFLHPIPGRQITRVRARGGGSITRCYDHLGVGHGHEIKALALATGIRGCRTYLRDRSPVLPAPTNASSRQARRHIVGQSGAGR